MYKIVWLTCINCHSFGPECYLLLQSSCPRDILRSFNTQVYCKLKAVKAGMMTAILAVCVFIPATNLYIDSN